MGYLGQKGDFLLCYVCNVCELMHVYPLKGVWHHLPHYSMQNAVSETQGPKDKKVWEMPGHQNQAKLFTVGILRAFNMLILYFMKFLKGDLRGRRFLSGGGWIALYWKLCLQVFPILWSLGEAGGSHKSEDIGVVLSCRGHCLPRPNSSTPLAEGGRPSFFKSLESPDQRHH